ncbi:MAG: hypothetical protein ACM3RX_03765 [Methanococcaceae archaeon]
MRKLMAVGLMLCILTVLVSGAGAVPEREDHNSRVFVSLSEYAGAYGTPSSAGDSYATATAYTEVGIGRKGVTIKGATQDSVSGGSGSYAVSGQTLGGYLP